MGPAPWAVGPQNIYALQALAEHDPHIAVPMGAVNPSEDELAWKEQRRVTLLDWGHRRETFMHRQPKCLMDQMVSGSGLYPIRMLEDTWLLPAELQMVGALEQILQYTGNAQRLARDMLTPLIYNIDVRIILDNSGSMSLDMYGDVVDSYGGGYAGGQFYAGDGGGARPSGFGGGNTYGGGRLSGSGGGGNWIDQQSMENPSKLRDIYNRMRQPGRNAAMMPPNSPMSPHHRRWFFAQDTLRKWSQAYNTMHLDPWVYLLNGLGGQMRTRLSQSAALFERQPQGGTPLPESIQLALDNHLTECPGQSLLLLVITDGEADNPYTFNAVLDQIQNNVYGDVQCCFMGLSLKQEDIEWFENEECDETRIRTVEAYEVEQRQIQLREVVQKEGAYNFEMHNYRVLVTNFFPSDYDYEAPLQNLRHRLYITCHGRDRWWGLNNQCWRLCCTHLCCTCCFVATCFHCNGWCQGNDCGKYQKPELMDMLCGEE
jgi:hypothetical protein